MQRMSLMTIAVVAIVGLALAGAAIAYAQRGASPAPGTAGAGSGPGAAQPGFLTVADAHAKAAKGEVVLVDVRTPQEWAQTGVPASAHAVTMHQDGKALLAALDKLLGNDRTKPLAIICRTGNRTTMLQAQLKQVGYTNVINVAEGVAGSRHGPGWFKAGLPTRPGSAAVKPPVVASQ